jgi:hypothetical protein
MYDYRKVDPHSNLQDQDPHKCAYDCTGHQTRKQDKEGNPFYEWHHPCKSHDLVGMYLCEAHHSLLSLGRKRMLEFELYIDKTLPQMHAELKELELKIVLAAGLKAEDIDKK